MVNYCEVVGCRSRKTKFNQELSFFSLPRDEERRKKWLDVIGRPDLIDKNFKCHFVCSLHFNKTQIIFKPQLVPDAIPSELLPDPPSTPNVTNKDCCDVSTQTEKSHIKLLSAAKIKGPDKKSLCVQTLENNTIENTKNYSTQTSFAPSTDTPRKRKFRDLLKFQSKKERKLQNELEK